MSRTPALHVITANDLSGGQVIYRTDAGGWTDHLAQAALWDDEAEAQLQLIEASGERRAVGTYLAEMRRGTSGPVPAHFREAFRARGPSIPLPGTTGQAGRDERGAQDVYPR